MNDNYDTFLLPSVISKEVKYVRLHKLEFDSNNKVDSKSVNELKSLMRDATWHIRAAFMDVLEDIEVEYK